MKNSKLKSITQNVLSYLLEMADDFAEIAVSRKGAYNVLQKNFGGADYTHKTFNKTLGNLKSCGYIETRDNGQSIILTNKAKMKLIDQIVLKVPRDHKLRYLVSFDIPENQKVQRNGFRRAIKNLGFVQIQQSLWIIDRNAGELVELASSEYKVEKYVAYFVCIKSNIDSFLNEKLTEKIQKDKNLP
jgi:DNA-binding transcriptional regulator PaaX